VFRGTFLVFQEAVLLFAKLPQDRADAGEDEVSDRNYYRQFDNHHGNAEEDLNDAESYAGGSQHEGDANGNDEDYQKDDANNS
jgi:hypothetical protein